MTQQNIKIPIDYLYHYINNLPSSINIKELTKNNTSFANARRVIIDYYVSHQAAPTDNDPYNWEYKINKHLTKSKVIKLGYIYKRLIEILELINNGDSEHYLYNEQWFIRQVIACNKNLNNPIFETIKLDDIYHEY